MDVPLGAIARGDTYNARVFSLIQDFEAHGKIEQFIRVVVGDKPKSPYLAPIVQWGIFPDPHNPSGYDNHKFELVSIEIEPRKMHVDPPVDFVIITALEEEREAVLSQLPQPQQLPPTEEDIRVYYHAQLPVAMSDGTQGNYEIIVLSLLNMGRVQATTAGSQLSPSMPKVIAASLACRP